MNSRCPVCDSAFEPEPGFYFGAMYITYAVNVALLIGIGLSLFYFGGLSETVSLVVIALLAAALTPPSFRYSRILWLHWFGGLHYRPRDGQ